MRTTTLGSLPGTDMGAALRLLFDETPELVALPELPARGVGADMVGRTLGIVPMGADVLAGRWTLADNPGIDQRRARALLRQDLDLLEEHAQGFTGVLKLSVAGPWTLASTAELRGQKVLGDRGARRELAAAQHEGVRNLLDELRRRLPEATWWLQLDEPMLAMVLAGAVKTASGYERYRAVEVSEAVEALDQFADLADTVALHFCGAPLPEITERTTLSAISVDLGRLAERDYDVLGPWLENGRQVWWGAVPTWPVDDLAPVDQPLGRVLDYWRRLGLDPDLHDAHSVITPACGLAGWSASPARKAIQQAARIAELAPEQLRR